MLANGVAQRFNCRAGGTLALKLIARTTIQLLDTTLVV